MESNKTFIRITNRNIYDKLESIEKKVNKTNSTVKFHTWAISFIVMIIVAIITRIL